LGEIQPTSQKLIIYKFKKKNPTHIYSHQTTSDVLCFRNCLLFIVVVVVVVTIIVSVYPRCLGVHWKNLVI
jgi:hypothetical protein